MIFLVPVFFIWSMFGFSAENHSEKHAFYVSITELEIADDTLQISMRVFTDDLELALKEFFGEKVFLNSPPHHTKNFVVIRDYLHTRVGLSNGAKSQITWIGHEFEADVCWIYGQIPLENNQRILFFKNATLTEVYAGQQNMVHLNIGGSIKTELATKSQPEVRFIIE